MKWCLLIFVALLGCASGEAASPDERGIREFTAVIDRDLVVPSSVISIQILNSSDRAATGAAVRFAGVLEGGQRLDESYYVSTGRSADGDLVAQVRVSDGLFAAAAPDTRRRFSGSVGIRLDDEVGVFGQAYLDDIDLIFTPELAPSTSEFRVAPTAHVYDPFDVTLQGMLMPDEGTTWGVVDVGEIALEAGATRQITNGRIPLEWTGSRERATFHVSPEIFGVHTGRFRGKVRFENQLRSGEVFEDAATYDVDITLEPSLISSIDPPKGSRGQRFTIKGLGFLPENESRGYGMYLKFEGTITPTDLAYEPRVYSGSSAIFRAPYKVESGSEIVQNVWADVTSNGQLIGLGATPGQFVGTVTPVLFDVTGDQYGTPWRGTFDILPTRQVVFVKFLPGFTRGLQTYGLKNVEGEVRSRILYVLRRTYTGLNVSFVDTLPEDFVDFTTIEIGGPDPNGLQNFGYDNSFNDGGKDLENLYLSDYLGGVNIHSQDAGYLPYGGVFIDSFIGFSPKLHPENFGTNASFDRIMGPVMSGLGGAEVSAEEWPDGDRAIAIEAAINLMGTLAGHTAAHEVGHSFGLAFFPSTVDGFEDKFHNDPPGNDWLMDSGSDVPFEERAEIEGFGPSVFSPVNRGYLERILPR